MFPAEAAAAIIPNNNTFSFLSGEDFACSLNVVGSTSNISPHLLQPRNKIKKKRSLPGHPDPDAEVIALSPETLLATNRFVCEICNRSFQREQNLQLHRRGHNLPWKLKRRRDNSKKQVYVCPQASCVHHHPSRALGDLTGIKKHFCRKHGEKKWKCHKCSKLYAVHSDWKAHSKTCGTRHYTCDCGAIFSRKDSFVTHRAFCDALAEESARLSAAAAAGINNLTWGAPQNPNPNYVSPLIGYCNTKLEAHHNYFSPLLHESEATVIEDRFSPHLSGPDLFHKMAVGTDGLGRAGRASDDAVDDSLSNVVMRDEFVGFSFPAASQVSWQENERLTRNFWV